MKKEASRSKSYLFVGIQFFLFIVYALFNQGWGSFHRPDSAKYVGLILAGLGGLFLFLSMIGLNKSLSPWPHPKSDGTLITHGPYAFIRHPIYTGILIAGLGWAIYSGSGIRLGIIFLLGALFFFKARYEESLLKQKFDSYEAYMTKTGMFLPKFW